MTPDAISTILDAGSTLAFALLVYYELRRGFDKLDAVSESLSRISERMGRLEVWHLEGRDKS